MKEYEVHIRVKIKAYKEDLDDCADIIVTDVNGIWRDSFEVIEAEWDRITPVSG